MTPTLSHFDHIVLTVADIAATVTFYKKLGMQVETFRPTDGSTRTALKFGTQKINLHQAGHEFEPKAKTPTTGSADFCLTTTSSLSEWVTSLTANAIKIDEGPVPRTGAAGKIDSIYLRDPDGNLIEISRYL